VRIPDDRTVVFTLTRPYAMFANVVALPQYAPIEASREDELSLSGSTYGSAPASSGPFVLKFNAKAGSVTLSRNPEWSQALDGVRTPQVDTIQWKIYSTERSLDQALLKGDVDVRLDGGLGQTARDLVAADQSLRSQIDEPTTGSVSYLALVPSAAPLDNKACREALLYAIDKSDLIKLRGGPDVLRATGNMVSPLLPGGAVSDDPYPTGATGSVEAARRKLIECGYPDGYEVNMAYVNLGVGKTLFSSVQRSLARVGIIVNPVQFDSFLAYFTTGVGSQGSLKDKQIGLVATNWYPEGTSPLSYFGPIADGRKITSQSNVNYSGLNDDSLNALLDELETGTPDVARVSRAAGSILMDSAYYLPYGMDQLVLYRGPHITNVYVQQALGGQYDVVNMGVHR
jgi:peptide/nickel transport system substrate-binding protein